MIIHGVEYYLTDYMCGESKIKFRSANTVHGNRINFQSLDECNAICHKSDSIKYRFDNEIDFIEYGMQQNWANTIQIQYK